MFRLMVSLAKTMLRSLNKIRVPPLLRMPNMHWVHIWIGSEFDRTTMSLLMPWLCQTHRIPNLHYVHVWSNQNWFWQCKIDFDKFGSSIDFASRIDSNLKLGFVAQESKHDFYT